MFYSKWCGGNGGYGGRSGGVEVVEGADMGWGRAGDGGLLFWLQMFYSKWCGGRSGDVGVVGGADMGCDRAGEGG